MISSDGPIRGAVLALAASCIVVAGAGAYCLVPVTVDAARGNASVLGAVVYWVFGLLAILAACDTWIKRRPARVRIFLAIVVTLCATEVIVNLDQLIAWMIGDSSRTANLGAQSPTMNLVDAITQLFVIISAVIFYRVFVRWLVAGLRVVDQRSLLERLQSMRISLGIVGLSIFTNGGEIIGLLRTHAPRSWQEPPGAAEPLVQFGPLLLAVAVYKIGMAIAARRLKRTCPTGVTETVGMKQVITI